MSLLSVDWRQVGILSDRYLDIVLGDARATGLLLLQAPAIGAAVAGVWSNAADDTLTLYFVLCLSAFFFGCVNACREIVKERALFLREKMFNLSIDAYLLSKFGVQAMLVVLQCAVLAGVVRVFVPLEINVLALGLVLVTVALTGTAVGLLVSAWTTTADRAVGMVPLIVIPQILFSDFALGEDQLFNWTSHAQRLMPVHWGYELLRTLVGTKIEWGVALGAPLILLFMIAFCFFFSRVRLSRARY